MYVRDRGGKGGSSSKREHHVLRCGRENSDERAGRVQKHWSERERFPPDKAKQVGNGRTLGWVCKVCCEV